MAIIRSKIARQLLAEGGAPRKGYFDAGRVGDPNTGNLAGSLNEAAGLGNTGQEDIDSTYTGGDFNVTPQGPSLINRIGDSIENRRQESIRNFVNRNMMSTRDAILSLNPFGPRTDMNLFDVYQQMNKQGGLFTEGLTGTRLDMDRAKQTFETLSKSKEDGGLGLDLTKDIGSQLDKISTADFRSAFNLDRPTSGGDSVPMLPRLPRIAKVPSDVEQQKSDLGEFIANIRGANPTAFNIPERFRLAEGGEPRQEYGLGSIVKKITGTVKKVAKSPIGKAALAIGLGAYGLGKGPFAPGAKFGEIFGAGFLKDLGIGAAIDEIPGGGVTAGIVGASLLGGLLTSKQPEQDINALSQRISDQTGIDVAKIRGEVQQAYQNKDTSSLAQKYPFLVDQEYSASFAKGGRIGFENGGSYKDFEEFMMKRGEAMKEFNRNKILEEFQKYMKSKDPTVEASVGGKIEDKKEKEGIMMASAPGPKDDYDDIARELFGKGYKELTPEELEMFQEELERLMNKFRGAKGGIASMAEGGMMDLGGNEMDLRGGGFVPIGAKEKADDVPARLSKNEFVFTADAVRAAGGGSVDRGADLMYKTMKQLENKVA